MSLILEALKKLERDKQVEGRSGFLVMAARPWPSGEGRWLFVASLALAGVGVTALMLAGAWWWHHAQRAAVAPPTAATLPLPAPGLPAEPRHVSGGSDTTSAPTADAAKAVAAPAARMASLAPPVHIIKDHAAAAPIPVAATTTSTSEIRLAAISMRDGRPVAIVNDRMVYVGDSFDGIKILRIGENEVEVEVSGRKQVVKF